MADQDTLDNAPHRRGRSSAPGIQVSHQHNSGYSRVHNGDVNYHGTVNQYSAPPNNLTGKLTNHDYENILKWLVTTDPSPIHNRSCELHEEHTCQWLLRSDIYNDWKNLQEDFVWMHGIPGSGKTVMASFIIEDVRRKCKEAISRDIGYAYYYCDFRRTQDETTHMLRWVLNSLCRQSNNIPEEIRSLYKEGYEPATKSLVHALIALASTFGATYIIIDALDESLERIKLLRILRKIKNMDKDNKIKLLTLSRPEHDIRTELADISIQLPLSNKIVDEDIRVYVTSQVKENSKLNQWPDDLKNNIVEALVYGAKGMFQLAACQIDMICRVQSARKIKEALTKLPKTLDEMYDRILRDIPNESRVYVQRTLKILSQDQFSKIHDLEDIAEAILVDVDNLTFDIEDRLSTPETLLELCTSLVIFKDGQVSLAHYTVEEYLCSDRVKDPFYRMSRSDTEYIVQRIYLVYCFSVPYDTSMDMTALNSSLLAINDAEDEYIPASLFTRFFPPFRLFTNAINHITSIVLPNDDISNRLALRLFDPKEPHFTCFIAAARINCYSDYFRIPTFKISPSMDYMITIAYCCMFEFDGAVKHLVREHSDPTMFQVELEIENYRELVSNRYDSTLSTKVRLLSIAFEYDRRDMIEFFLDSGAEVNFPSAVSQMQAFAIARHEASYFDESDLKFLGLLLKYGADVNGVGSDDEVIKLLESKSSSPERSPHESDDSIAHRGEMWYYDTPLRILETALKDEHSLYVNEMIQALMSFLETHGGMSLHLFPIKGFPGYMEEDIIAFEEVKKKEQEQGREKRQKLS